MENNKNNSDTTDQKSKGSFLEAAITDNYKMFRAILLFTVFVIGIFVILKFVLDSINPQKYGVREIKSTSSSTSIFFLLK